MKSMIKKTLCLALALMMGLALLPVHAEQADKKPLEGKHLVIAMSPDFMFFETISTTDETGYEGLDIDIIKHLSKELGFTFEITPMAFASLVGALQTGGVDFVISGMSYTEARAEVVDFSNPYASTKVGCVTLVGSPIDSPEKLEGQTIACSQGTNYENVIKGIKGTTLKTYQGQAAVGMAVAQGSDGVVAGLTSSNGSKKLVATVLGANGEALLTYFTLNEGVADQYSIAFPKGSELKDLFNAELEKMTASGLLPDLIQKWLY
ncbi:MAG: amino acid ABC transporter substrate-binding protein [Clostridiales bacterium]|mgnify:CR=1 FL=1|nr:amino acid ABC transporter substrate-binding protein [Clostridiales bacterium]